MRRRSTDATDPNPPALASLPQMKRLGFGGFMTDTGAGRVTVNPGSIPRLDFSKASNSGLVAAVFL